jgi:hypothetical protein
MANQVELRLVIRREAGTKKRVIEFFRDGHGDDLIDNAADYFERVFQNAMATMLEQTGGRMTKEPPPDPNELPPAA